MDNGTRATSREQADAQLQELRDQRDVADQRYSAIITGYNNSLAIISDQLYKKQTRFLMELIQNADDNKFAEGVEPSLRIELLQQGNSWTLETSCNEIGFTFEQLNALLSVGSSTKKSIEKGRRGYIGEKGIGFKSVFKVANVVAVASGHYEFQLDRQQPLGMVRPILADFPPAHRLAGQTQFRLHLNNKNHYHQISTELDKAEPQILIFLQKLRVLSIITSSLRVIYQLYIRDHDKDTGGEIARILMTGKSNGESVLKRGKYIIQRYSVLDMPSEPLREGISTSEVILAFQVRVNENEPVIKSQKAYAFLPIEPTGLKFMIQADFLLVASREAIQSTSLWNDRLLEGLVAAFLKAVERFLSIPVDALGRWLRYAWPSYLSDSQGVYSHWADLRRRIKDRLSWARIIETQDQPATLAWPVFVYYVPKAFRLNGSALFSSPTFNRKHASFEYDPYFHHLEFLGIQTMNKIHLFIEFKDWLQAVGDVGFRSQSQEWHEKISQLFVDADDLKTQLQVLPIIPIENGDIVSANSGRIYLPPEKKKEHVPQGISLSVVETDASENVYRRRFFKFLGIKTYNPKEVCNIILELHEDHSLTRTIENMVSDVAYLFEHRDLLDRRVASKLLFKVASGTLLRNHNSRFYIEDPAIEPNLVTKYKDAEKTPFLVIHPLYEATICGGSSLKKHLFHRWLTNSSKVFNIPQVVNARYAAIGESILTNEWKFLSKKSVTDLLISIKLQWGEIQAYRQFLAHNMQGLQAQCLDGIFRHLRNLAMPTSTLRRRCPNLNYLDVPEPRANDWGFLSHFGVITNLDEEALRQELSALSRLPMDKVDKKTVCDIYNSLGSNVEDSSRTREHFEDPLVFIDTPSPRWVRHSSCVWTAPNCLKKVTRLQSHYPTCRSLFHDILKVHPAGLEHIVDELCSLSTEHWENISERSEVLLRQVANTLSKGNVRLKKHIDRLKLAHAFPVSMGPETQTLLSLNQTWYIPDKTTLHAAFEGRVKILDFSVKIVQSLKPVFQALECEGRYLSEVVVETVRPCGTALRDMQRENDLNTRLKYILRLSPDIFWRTRHMKIQVWSVPSITIKRSLGDCHVSEDNGLVNIRESGNTTKLYFRRQTAAGDEPDVINEMTKYFCDQLDIKPDDIRLLYYLLTGPTCKLNSFMEANGRFALDDESDEDSEVEASPSPVPVAIGHRLNQHSGSGGGGPSSGASSDEDGSNINTSTLPRTGLSFQLPIPSLESRIQRIADSASLYTLDLYTLEGSILSSPPRNSTQSSGLGFQTSLPIRMRAEGDEEIPTASYSLPSSGSDADSDVVPTPASATRESASFTSSVNAASNRQFRFGAPFTSSTPSGSRGGQFGSTSSVPNARHGNPTTPPTNAGPTDEDKRAIGFQGELFVFKVFSRYIDDWSYENWTGKLRVEAGYPPFTLREKDFADFTYTDELGYMKPALERAGLSICRDASRGTKYHLEVKSTLGDGDEPFFLSQNQHDKMRKYHDDPNNEYIIVRVYNLEGDEEPKIQFYPDPWKLYLDRVLDVISTGVYAVRRST